jgi:hypothetical protein
MVGAVSCRGNSLMKVLIADDLPILESPKKTSRSELFSSSTIFINQFLINLSDEN